MSNKNKPSEAEVFNGLGFSNYYNDFLECLKERQQKVIDLMLTGTPDKNQGYTGELRALTYLIQDLQKHNPR